MSLRNEAVLGGWAMVRFGILVVAGILSAGVAAAQSNQDMQPAAQTAPSVSAVETNASLPSGTPIRAVMTSSVDSKKLKPNDKVTAETTDAIKREDGKTIIPSGAKLIGHVTQSAARGKGDSFSSVGIVFDKAVLKHGQEVPLNVSIQALAAAPQQPTGMGAAPDIEPGPAGSPGMSSPGRPGTSSPTPPPSTGAGSVPNAVGNADANNAMSGKGAAGGLDNSGRLTADSRGVFGLQGIGLTAGTVGSEPGTVITSTGKEVRLDGGTQLLLVTRPAEPKQAAN
jgi:hypothetical protein